jgi:hypothetical protein
MITKGRLVAFEKEQTKILNFLKLGTARKFPLDLKLVITARLKSSLGSIVTLKHHQNYP